MVKNEAVVNKRIKGQHIPRWNGLLPPNLGEPNYMYVWIMLFLRSFPACHTLIKENNLIKGTHKENVITAIVT